MKFGRFIFYVYTKAWFMAGYDRRILWENGTSDVKGIRVKTKEEPIAQNYHYIDEINQTSIVHYWKFKMNDVSMKELS